MRTINFSIPLKWNKTYISEVLALETSSRQISDFYGCIQIDDLPSGRTHIQSESIELNKAKEIIKFLHAYNKKFRYLLNAPHYRLAGDRNFYSKIEQIIEVLNPDSFVCSSEYTIGVIREICPEMPIHLSTISRIRDEWDLNKFIHYSPSKVVPQHDIPKRVPSLMRLKESLDANGIEIEIMVTESCLFDCRQMKDHYLSISLGHDDYQFHKCCLGKRFMQPWQFFAAGSFVPPEDIDHYVKIGIFNFKLTGRSKSEAFLLNLAKHYLMGSFEGNLIEIMGISDTYQPSKYFYIASSAYHGFIEELMLIKSDNPETLAKQYCDQAIASGTIRINDKS